MKNKRIKTFLKLGMLFFGILISVIACQKDNDIVIQEAQKANVKLQIEMIPFSSLQNDYQSFAREFNRNNTSSLSRDISEGITIDTNSVKQITYEDYTSYTFASISQGTELLLENVMISEVSEDVTDYFLLTYELDVSIDDINGDNFYDHVLSTTTLEIQATDIIYSTQARTGGNCWSVEDITTWYCYDSSGEVVEATGQPDGTCDGSQGASFTETVTVLTIDLGCSGGGGSSPAPPTGDGDNSPPGGNSGPGGDLPDDSGITQGTLPCRNQSTSLQDDNGCSPVQEDDTDEKNCQKLSTLGDDPQIKAVLQDLHNKAVNSNNHREFGYKFEEGQAPEELQLLNGNPSRLDPEYGGLINGNAHTHQDKDFSNRKVYPMFSIDDIFNFGTIVIRHTGDFGRDYSDFFFTLTVQRGSGNISETYALKVKDWLAFTPFLNTYYTMTKQERGRLETKLGEKYQEVYENNGGNIPKNYEKPLLKFMNDLDINGVDIYRATNLNYTDWEKLNYDAETNSMLPPTDCNN